MIRVAELRVSCSRRAKLTDTLSVNAVETDTVTESVGHNELITTVGGNAVRPTELSFTYVDD